MPTPTKFTYSAMWPYGHHQGFRLDGEYKQTKKAGEVIYESTHDTKTSLDVNHPPPGGFMPEPAKDTAHTKLTLKKKDRFTLNSRGDIIAEMQERPPK